MTSKEIRFELKRLKLKYRHFKPLIAISRAYNGKITLGEDTWTTQELSDALENIQFKIASLEQKLNYTRNEKVLTN